MASKKTSKRPSRAPAFVPPVSARIVKYAPRIDRQKDKAEELKLAGVYRVIHGSLEIPLPWDQWHTPSGREIPGAPKTVRATIRPVKFALADDRVKGIQQGEPIEWEGDEVELDDQTAYQLLAMDKPEDERPMHALVEPLTVPKASSRVGKVWKRPAAAGPARAA